MTRQRKIIHSKTYTTENKPTKKVDKDISNEEKNEDEVNLYKFSVICPKICSSAKVFNFI